MIDYGIGNYRSVQKAIEFVEGTADLTADPDKIGNADKLFLIGVGAFGATMDALNERNQVDAVHHAVQKGTPLIGICVGMQVLLEDSDEIGFHTGLGLIPGHVRRFPETVGLKVPHIGWNQVEHDGSSPFLAGVEPADYAYFVHSYCCHPDDDAHTLAHTEHGHRYTSVIGRDNIYGIQFHAEKSQHVGLQILRNFLAM